MRKAKRPRILPKRFRDTLPEPPPSFLPQSHVELDPLEVIDATLPDPPLPLESSNGQSPTMLASMRSQFRKLLRSPRNVFGLSRQYTTEEPPSHDPEEILTLNDLCSFPPAANLVRPSTFPSSSSATQTNNPYAPYPNLSSFRLGEWYWNDGVQKSRESFRNLTQIVGDPGYRPDDVAGTNWAHIDACLGSDSHGEEEWEDEGWHSTPITISIPFHQRTDDPGPRDFLAGNLHHRSLVSVIREKLANTDDDREFHYEPYELNWKPGVWDEVRVQGELYTSPAFLEAHEAMQSMPGEPRCDLPRVIVALMFWSDATHLTSFGNAKLWPLYLFFGNESKYRRCTPSYHLCNHVAYFEAVRDGPSIFSSTI